MPCAAGATAQSVVDAYVERAEVMLADDLADNKAIGEAGADDILRVGAGQKINMLTICNTGSLATAGYGTALGVVRSVAARGALQMCYACETRPYNQGLVALRHIDGAHAAPTRSGCSLS